MSKAGIMLAFVGAVGVASARAEVPVPSTAYELSHLFSAAAIVGQPRLVDCRLSGGTNAKCFAITVKGKPADHIIGPWCPARITDTKQAGGIWLDNGKVHDVDGPFIESLAAFYKDPKWQLYDAASGKVRVTDSKAACEAAARPDVDPAYNNYCVQCLLEYVDQSTEQTYVIPIKPVDAANVGRVAFGGAGVALNGVRLDGPAPTDAILAAHTLAPFDDCGGHVNPHVGYHYHAAMGCSKQEPSAEGHAAVIGLALDGYRIHAAATRDSPEPADLDSCRGHTAAGLGYHYHANDPGQNAILTCHKGETGCVNAGSSTECDAAAVRLRRPPR